MFYVVAAAAVVVVALLVLVFVAPALTTSGKSSVIEDQTYSQALPIANSAVSGYQGGGWALVLAVGFDTAVSETLPINETALGTGNCSFTSTGVSNNLTIPGTSVNRSSGSSPAWGFGYRNGADAITLVDVLSGTASVLGTLSGKCVQLYGLLSAVPANVIDSSTAAAAVKTNASVFLAAYPNASAEFALVGGISFLGQGIGAEWSVVYSTCSLSPTASGTGSEFNATVNATTGRVLYTATTTGVSCAGTTTTTGTTYSLGSSLALARSRS